MGMGKEIPARGKPVPVAGTRAYLGNVFVSDNSELSRLAFALLNINHHIQNSYNK
jgi:hypothetical protein